MTQAAHFIDIDTLANDDQTLIDVPVVFDEDAEAIAGFKIVGKNSSRYQDAQRAIEILAIKRAVVKKQKIDAKTDEGAGQFVDITKENQIKVAVAVVVGMYGFKSGGQDVEPNAEILTKIFNSKPTWLQKVTAALENEASFLQA